LTPDANWLQMQKLSVRSYRLLLYLGFFLENDGIYYGFNVLGGELGGSE
jgi:hypothetical protein